MTSTADVLLRVPLAQTLGVALCGGLVGLGTWVGVAAALEELPETEVSPAWRTWLDTRLTTPMQRWIALTSLLAAAIVAVGLRLPVLAALVAGAMLVALEVLHGPSMREVAEIGAGVSAWAETVRQELEAGRPQRAALIAACDLSPPGLEHALQALGERLEVLPIPEALRGFAVEVRHPAVGHVVAALDVAYRYGAADLPKLMAGQVESTRHQVQMIREIHAARAKHRRAMVLLLGLFVSVVVGLFVIWPQFLAAYRGVQGQLVLAAMGAGVLVAVRELIGLSQGTPPPDFFTSPTSEVEPGAAQNLIRAGSVGP
jgi:Flp pilus assembly protein TadB